MATCCCESARYLGVRNDRPFSRKAGNQSQARPRGSIHERTTGIALSMSILIWSGARGRFCVPYRLIALSHPRVHPRRKVASRVFYSILSVLKRDLLVGLCSRATSSSDNSVGNNCSNRNNLCQRRKKGRTYTAEYRDSIETSGQLLPASRPCATIYDDKRKDRTRRSA